MIIKAEMTVAIGQYENLKPTVEIDMDNLVVSLGEIEHLREQIHKLMVLGGEEELIDANEVKELPIKK
jgi:hypothetical protein